MSNIQKPSYTPPPALSQSQQDAVKQAEQDVQNGNTSAAQALLQQAQQGYAGAGQQFGEAVDHLVASDDKAAGASKKTIGQDLHALNQQLPAGDEPAHAGHAHKGHGSGGAGGTTGSTGISGSGTTGMPGTTPAGS